MAEQINTKSHILFQIRDELINDDLSNSFAGVEVKFTKSFSISHI